MKIMYKILEFCETHSRDIKKGKNIAYMIWLYCALTTLTITLEVLLDITGFYLVIFEVFSLIIILLFYLYQKSKLNIDKVWPKRKMNIKTFFMMLSLIKSADLITTNIIQIIYSLMNTQDTIIPGTVASFGTDPYTIIRVILIGPILEEIIFRGSGLSLFKKGDNKLEAIIFTSLLFGLMHGNLAQAIHASVSGLIYGYLSVEFGIIYSIIFHMLNNGLVYLNHFLNLNTIITSISVLMLIWSIWNRNEIIKEFKIHLNYGKDFSVKRLLSYFMNPFLLFCTILLILSIIISF